MMRPTAFNHALTAVTTMSTRSSACGSSSRGGAYRRTTVFRGGVIRDLRARRSCVLMSAVDARGGNRRCRKIVREFPRIPPQPLFTELELKRADVLTLGRSVFRCSLMFAANGGSDSECVMRIGKGHSDGACQLHDPRELPR